MHRPTLSREQRRAVARVARALAAVQRAKERRDQAVREAVTGAGIPPYRLSVEVPGGLSPTHARRIAYSDPPGPAEEGDR